MKIVRELFIVLSVVFGVGRLGTAIAQESITFPDQNLEAAVRSALAIPTGPLTPADLGRLDSLSATHQSIVNLSGLEWATNLTSLDLSGNSISNLVPLGSLNRLVQLRLDRNQIADLAPVARLPNLGALNAARNQIASAGVLGVLTNVSSLRLYGNAISDLSFVSGMARISSLDLEDNLISDLSPVIALTNLSLLRLSGNRIGDLSPLSGLSNLTNLSLRNLGIASLDFLRDLRQLRSLDLERNRIKDLTPLAGMTSLSHLNLRWNRVTNYNAVLAGFTNLTVLYLGGNWVSNVNFLENLSHLGFLNLSENSIKDLSPISNLTNLNYLVLSGNPIANFSALSGLTNLVNLELRGNSIRNLDFMSGLTWLNYADLAYNNILDVAPLVLLTNLGSLVIDGNPINRRGLPRMAHLTNLWLCGNSVSNLSCLQSLNQLRSLGLDDNSVADLSPLAALTNLTSLGLRRNPITNYAALAGFTNLTSLWLDGSSITNFDFLAGLSALKALGLRGTRMGDLDALGGLTNLVDLFADYNRLTNIAVLQNLPRLSRVQLVGNPLEVRTGPIATAIKNLQHRAVEVGFMPTNDPPQIVISTNWFIAVNDSSSLNFQLWDDLTSGDELVVTITSSNPGLVANGDVVLSGTNFSRTLTVTPTTNQTGTATITLTAHDDAGTSTIISVQVAVLLPQPVAIPDPNLEAAIRSTLNRPSGSLTSVDLQALTALFAFENNVASLSGLEWATNLAHLYLNSGLITDLTVLQNLSHLTSFTLYNDNKADLSPLAGLTNLLSLYLVGNSTSNLTFLQNLTLLATLNLDNNHITDLEPVTGLTNLNSISLLQNRLTNIAPLQNLPQLTRADIGLNLLDINSNSPAATIIQSLQSRGVVVNYQPQREPPSIAVRPTWVIMSNATSSLSFGAKDNAAFAGQFSVTAKSSNTNLLSNESLVVGQGANTDWFLSVTPTSDRVGATTITLTATNDVAMGTSTSILVTVVVPLPLNDQLLGGGNFVWVTGGNVAWFGQTVVAHGGGSAAQSGSIINDQESWMQTTLEGPGILTFWWKVSSELSYDWLEIHLNGQLQPDRISGEVDWQQKALNVPRGTQVVRWRYFKEAADSSGLDTAWVDQVTFLPLSWLELVGSPTNGQCQLLLHPVLDKLYQLQASTNLADWLPLAVVVGTNTAMPFVDLTANLSRCFYRLQELSASAIWLQNPKRSESEFSLEVHSPTGLRFEVQVSTDLVNWSGLGVISNALGKVQYSEMLVTGSPMRFYRVLLVP